MWQRIGFFLIVVGVALVLLGRWPFWGRLPGDIAIKREHGWFYFPITSSLLLSILLSALLSLALWWTSRKN